jgi:hypothetical protein
MLALAQEAVYVKNCQGMVDLVCFKGELFIFGKHS